MERIVGIIATTILRRLLHTSLEQGYQPAVSDNWKKLRSIDHPVSRGEGAMEYHLKITDYVFDVSERSIHSERLH